MSTTPRQAPLLSVRETAELLAWKLSRTYEATRRREIPGLVEVNGRLLYRRRVVEAWLSGELPEVDTR
jgi:hypothetical protein